MPAVGAPTGEAESLVPNGARRVAYKDLPVRGKPATLERNGSASSAPRRNAGRPAAIPTRTCITVSRNMSNRDRWNLPCDMNAAPRLSGARQRLRVGCWTENSRSTQSVAAAADRFDGQWFGVIAMIVNARRMPAVHAGEFARGRNA